MAETLSAQTRTANTHIAPIAPDPFYPIVPDIDWMRRIVPLGVRTIQLRLKDASDAEVDRQVGAGLDLCRQYACQFIVNDYWQAAIRHGCEDLHLGQEDLESADLAAIQDAGIRVGISTHDERELDIALAAKPAYIALGPIYETKLKAMRFGPQGLEQIGVWKRRIGDVPLIAIGGITPERARGVIAAGADSVSVITDFFTADDPEARVRQWLDWASGIRAASSPA